MKINRAELQTALEKVRPGLASREMIQQTTSFAFMGDRVVTYNDVISISHPIQGLNVRGAVKAQALYEFLRKVKRDELDIEWQENQIKITAGRSIAGLTFEQEIKLPIEAVGEIGEWQKLPDGFVDALKFCLPCCSRDMSRSDLTCVHLRGNHIEASDGYQIVQCKLDGEVPVKSLLIPATAVSELVKYPISEIAQGEGWSHFRTADGATIFSCRVVEGQFREISRYLEFDGTELHFPKSLTEALERAQIFAYDGLATEDMPVAVIELSEGQVKVSAKNDFGWFEETARTKYKGDRIRFTINVEFLRNLLARESVCIFGGDRKIGQKLRFSGPGWIHIVVVIAEADGKGGEK